jgi:hypothetical protein
VVIPNAAYRGPTGTAVTYIYASEYLELLDHRRARLKLNRLSLHADILKERHESGTLGDLSPWRRFQDADVFLYLRSALATEKINHWEAWRPWSAGLLRGCPGFLMDAEQRKKAERLMKALDLQSVDEFRARLKEVAEGLRRMFSDRDPFFSPFQGLNPDLIGTK